VVLAVPDVSDARSSRKRRIGMIGIYMILSNSSTFLSIIDERFCQCCVSAHVLFSRNITSALVTICHIINAYGHFSLNCWENATRPCTNKETVYVANPTDRPQPPTTASLVIFFLFKLLRPLQLRIRPHLTPAQATRQNCLAGPKGRPAIVLPHPCQ
jgi:hypothetical protein